MSDGTVRVRQPAATSVAERERLEQQHAASLMAQRLMEYETAGQRVDLDEQYGTVVRRPEPRDLLGRPIDD